MHVKHGWWSESLFVRMPEVWMRFLLLVLQRILSMSVALVVENRVGEVTSGVNPSEQIE
jgi:hypothetical protein